MKGGVAWKFFKEKLNMRHYTNENENLTLTGILVEKVVCHPCSVQWPS